MFGQTSAVYSFPRFSRALSAIAGCLFSLITVEFFDDLSQVEPLITSESAQFTMESLLKLLGCRIADSEKKRKPFAKKFVSLGVQVGLSGISAGLIHLEQKPGRVEALKEQVDKILELITLTWRDALSVCGRIYFSEGQTFGSVAAPEVHMLTRWNHIRTNVSIGDQDQLVLGNTSVN